MPGRPAEAPGTTPARARARPATAAVSYAKDHDMLIKAWAHVAARHPDRAQRIVGGHESGAPGHRNRAECETRITGHAYRIPGREDSPHRTGRSSPEENRHGKPDGRPRSGHRAGEHERARNRTPVDPGGDRRRILPGCTLLSAPRLGGRRRHGPGALYFDVLLINRMSK
ncbi:hypothetical protein CYL17_04110 [Thermobispora bispora]|nr:hypothetical protein [Actinomycetales bacterium]QSI47124.1 hypothetical protein CYL17_04110 [Thermobispora bispora]